MQPLMQEAWSEIFLPMPIWFFGLHAFGRGWPAACRSCRHCLMQLDVPVGFVEAAVGKAGIKIVKTAFGSI